MNSVSLVGRLVGDPASRPVPGGQRVARFRIAVSTGSRRGGGADRTVVEVECWGPLGDTVATYLAGGRMVSVLGRLTRASWSGQGPGECRHERVFVTAAAVEFLDRPPRTPTPTPSE
jgi:single stranded DNA-binding protein